MHAHRPNLAKGTEQELLGPARRQVLLPKPGVEPVGAALGGRQELGRTQPGGFSGLQMMRAWQIAERA